VPAPPQGNTPTAFRLQDSTTSPLRLLFASSPSVNSPVFASSARASPLALKNKRGGESSRPHFVPFHCPPDSVDSRRHEGSGRQAQKLWPGDPQTPRFDRKPNCSNYLCARLSEGHFGPVTGRCWTGDPARNAPDRQMRRYSPGRRGLLSPPWPAAGSPRCRARRPTRDDRAHSQPIMSGVPE
jgi:hypothetical protein